jgi:hypothetical protein
MAITDELRHNIEGAEQLYGRECPRLRAIADRIDEEHKKAMDDSYRDGYQEGKRDGDDDWYEEHESYLEEHGWYQALDADKQVIYADDELFLGGDSVGRVTAIGVGQRAGWVWTLTEGDTVSIGHNANLLLLRHHHEPTVEDVLRDFGKAWVEWEDGSPCDPIAKFAAKLRLAGDGE